MPTKTENEEFTATCVHHAWTDGKTTRSDEYNTNRKWTTTRIGQELPGWRDYIRQRRSATTGYTVRGLKYHNVSYSAFSKIQTKTGTPYGTLESLVLGPPPGMYPNAAVPTGTDFDSADISARSQFVSNYRSKRTQFQSGVFLGEMMEAVKMIASPARSLRQKIMEARSASQKRLRKFENRWTREVVADTWLEYSFGWKPLINDAKDALKLATAEPMIAQQYCSGSGTQSNADIRGNGHSGLSLVPVDWRTRRLDYAQVKYKGAIGAKNEPPGFPEQCGLSWSNALPTVWELLPYSFLIDYFVNVGKVIDGISTGRIWLTWGCKNVKLRSEYYVDDVRFDDETFSHSGPATAERFGGASGGGKVAEAEIFTRGSILSVGLGLADTRFKLPGSTTQWLNIPALIAARRQDRAKYSSR